MSRIVLLHPSTGPAGLRQSLTDAGHLVITLGPPAGPASARALRRAARGTDAVLLDARAGGTAARGDIVEDELHEVLIPVSDDRVLDRACRVLAGPGGLPGRAVSVETGSGSGDPVAEPLAGVGEVAVPSRLFAWCEVSPTRRS